MSLKDVLRLVVLQGLALKIKVKGFREMCKKSFYIVIITKLRSCSLVILDTFYKRQTLRCNLKSNTILLLP